MDRSHTPLNIWFWAAYLVMSHTPGISAVQFQRQLGLSRYETAFGILHKLRAGMRPDQDRIGGKPDEHVKADETDVGGRTRGDGRGVHHKILVACAVKVRHRKPGTAQDKRKDGRYAGRVRLAVTQIEAAISSAGLSRRLLLLARSSLRMIGAATLDRASGAPTTRPLPNAALASGAESPTYAELYAGDWAHPTFSGCLR
jgi:hypothetical protein